MREELDIPVPENRSGGRVWAARPPVEQAVGVTRHPCSQWQRSHCWTPVRGAGVPQAIEHGHDPEELVRPKEGARERSYALVDTFLDRIARVSPGT